MPSNWEIPIDSKDILLKDLTTFLTDTSFEDGVRMYIGLEDTPPNMEDGLNNIWLMNTPLNMDNGHENMWFLSTPLNGLIHQELCGSWIPQREMVKKIPPIFLTQLHQTLPVMP